MPSPARIATVGALLVGLAAGCTKVSHGVRASNQLVFATIEPRSLDPLYLEGTSAYNISEIGFSFLTNYDSDGTVITDVAREIPTAANGGISADGTRLTFHLRHGVVWQDGAPLTARDVVFTYRAILNPENALPSRYGYDRVASVTAPDPYTVVVRTRKPFSPILTYFLGGDSNYPILPEHLLGRYSSLDRVDFNQSPIGSGPYRYETWKHGDVIPLAANARYYAGTPAIERMQMRFIPDPNTQIAQLATGEIDAAFFLNAMKLDLLRRIPNHRVVVTPVPYVDALIFNAKDTTMRDLAVRRAFALAIDRDAIVRQTSHGANDAETGMRGVFTWAYDAAAGNVPYDPRAAAALLASDGWIAGADGIRAKDGHRLEVQIVDELSYPVEDQMVTLIAERERAIGIEVTRKRFSDQQFVAPDGPMRSAHYQVALEQFQAAGDPDASWLLACDQMPPNGFNEAYFCDPAVDRALAHAASVFERAARMRDYAFIQRRLLTELPYYFLCQIGEIDVVPSSLHGYDRPFLAPFNSIARWRY